MNVDHLLNLLYVGSLYAAGGFVVLAISCLPFGAFQASKHHDKKLLRFCGTCLGIAVFFATVAGVLYFTAVQASKPL